MDQKFKRFAKTCKIFQKKKKSSNIKAKTLQKPEGKNFFCRSDRGWSNPHSPRKIMSVQ